MDVKELRNKMDNKFQKAKSIVQEAKEEDRNMTEEEREEYDNLVDEVEELREDIERMEKANNLEGYMRDSANEPIKPEVDVKVGGSEEESRFENIGEFMRAAFDNPRNLPDRLREARDMEMKIGSKGGFLVPDEFMSDILEVDRDDAIMRPRATVIPASDETPDAGVTMPALDQSEDMHAGVEVEWIEEGAEKPETDASLKAIKLEPSEVAAKITLTDKVIRNAGALQSLAENLLQDAILSAEDQAFLKGNGVGKPLGFIDHPATIKHQRDTSDEIKYEDIVNMYSRVKMGGSLIWITNQTTLPQLMQMQDPDGNYIWQPNAREGAPGNLLGIPVLINERTQKLGTTGDLMLVDPTYYLIKDGFGIELAASEHAKFSQNKTVVKATWNVDGQPWLTDAIQPEHGGDTISPFVVLGEK